MTDVFGEWVDRNWQLQMFDAMAKAPNQTFQVLTKRPHIMRAACEEWMSQRNQKEIPSNIWLGTTVENQDAANTRIPELIEIPCSVRFLSCEPLLEDIDISRWNWRFRYTDDGDDFEQTYNIQWVIVGGESGRSARPCNLEWIANLVEECEDAHIACFVKQLGAKPIVEDQRRFRSKLENFIEDPKGANILGFPEKLRIRDFPEIET